MKLYAFQPKGHGQLSFFVMAETKEQAIEQVGKHIAEDGYDYNASRWGTDYYECTEVGPGVVIENEND